MQNVKSLYEATKAVLSTFDLDQVLNRILLIVRDQFRLQGGSIMLLEPETQELRVAAIFGHETGVGDRIRLGNGLTGTAALEKRLIYAPDVSKDPRYLRGVATTRSEVAIPLIVGDEVVGVLDGQSAELERFDPETLELLQLFAAQASVGIENATLYSQLQRRARQMEAITALAKETTVQVEIKELLERFCNQIPETFPLDEVAVFLKDEDGVLELRARCGDSERPIDERRFVKLLLGRDLNDLPIRSKTRAVVSDPPCIEGVLTEVVLPLLSFGDELGALICGSTKQTRIQSNDLTTLELVADIVATSVQNAAYVERIKQLAYRDGLTGVFNRRFFEYKLNEEISRHSRYGGNVSMLMLDVDRFKQINDDFGHLLGDEVLRTVTTLIARHVRKVDYICRYGGEEIAIILPSTDHEAAHAVADKLRRVFEAHGFPGVPRAVTVSIGVSEFPSHGFDRDQIVGAADAALLTAKQAGRNRVVVAPLAENAAGQS